MGREWVLSKVFPGIFRLLVCFDLTCSGRLEYLEVSACSDKGLPVKNHGENIDA